MNNELNKILIGSFLAAIGFMWVVGGIAVILEGFEMHWAAGWSALFIWIWGCGAAGLYFNVQRFFS